MHPPQAERRGVPKPADQEGANRRVSPVPGGLVTREVNSSREALAGVRHVGNRGEVNADRASYKGGRLSTGMIINAIYACV